MRPTRTTSSIPDEQRHMAALAHPSGLSGYVVRLGGILVPVALWLVMRESRVVARIAQQAVLLNVVVFAAAAAFWLVLLVSGFEGGLHQPLHLLLGVALYGVLMALIAGAVVLPIVGAVQAGRGEYYRYPVAGLLPG